MNAALNLDALHPVTLTKCCRRCHRQLPLDTFRLVGRPGAKYRDANCPPCRLAYQRERYAMGPAEKRLERYLPPRDRHEMECDAAFRDWRDAGAPFIGPRV